MVAHAAEADSNEPSLGGVGRNGVKVETV